MPGAAASAAWGFAGIKCTRLVFPPSTRPPTTALAHHQPLPLPWRQALLLDAGLSEVGRGGVSTWSLCNMALALLMEQVGVCVFFLGGGGQCCLGGMGVCGRVGCPCVCVTVRSSQLRL